MKNIVKKIAIFSMVGMMQIGFGASVIEASPLHNDGPYMQQQDDQHDQDRHERERIENERHEREMRRRDHESEREWHERQERERQRHDNTMNEIAAGVIGILIGSQIH
jgi:membrane protein involved in colicin uptake